MWPFSYGFERSSYVLIHVTCQVHLIPLDLISLTILMKSSLLCNFLTKVTPISLYPNIPPTHMN